jgi:hypothetical protein
MDLAQAMIRKSLHLHSLQVQHESELKYCTISLSCTFIKQLCSQSHHSFPVNVTSECRKFLRPNLVILNLDLQFGSGHAISPSVDIQSFGCVTRCFAANSGNTAAIYEDQHTATERFRLYIYPANISKFLDLVANTASRPQV